MKVRAKFITKIRSDGFMGSPVIGETTPGQVYKVTGNVKWYSSPPCSPTTFMIQLDDIGWAIARWKDVDNFHVVSDTVTE